MAFEVLIFPVACGLSLETKDWCNIKRDCEMANMSETDKTRIVTYLPDLSFERRFYVKTDWRDYADKMLEWSFAL
jgi:hypothetical protein